MEFRSREHPEGHPAVAPESAPGLGEPTLSPVNAGDSTPLSFAQERLWFLDQLEPNSSVYNVPIGLRLRGPLNLGALERSLNEIVRRHEALRTHLPTLAGKPVQRISANLVLSLSPVDLASLPSEERDNAARRSVNEEAKRPFDLARGPLIRVVLFRLGAEDHILLLTLHHIVSDAWSVAVLYRELTLLYNAFSAARETPLPELPVQYTDFARWQRDRLQGETLEQQVSYWKAQLKGLAPLELATDRPRPSAQSFRGASETTVIPAPLAQEVKTLARRAKATLFMTLLAAFNALLYRYTGREDIVVGSPIANRIRVEFEPLIGFFLNTLALRTDLSGRPSFLDLLRRVRETAFDAYVYQELPFEKLVEELQPERLLSQNPLFQILFVFQKDSLTELALAGLAVTPVSIEHNTAKFDLTLSMAERENGLKATAQYSTDLYDAATIRRMLGHFRSLLEGIVADPHLPIDDLPFLSGTEQLEILAQSRNSSSGESGGLCVHEMFEAQVKRTPDAIAAVFENEHLTYEELNVRANRLAYRLQCLGVAQETAVGLFLERSLEMIIAVLAVLKANGACLPLDPAYPSERVGFMMEDSRASVLLTQRHLAEDLPPHTAQVLLVDAEIESHQRENRPNPVCSTGGENLAYVIYTSGSTGKPKGVAMGHGSLSNLIAWQQDHFENPRSARTLQFASMSFDVSFQEIFSTLCSGGTLLLIPEELRRDPSGLMRYLNDRSVERLLLPFVALQRLAEIAQENEAIPMSLREVITAGEQLQITSQVRQLFSLRNCALRNQYGPSESHVVTAFTPMGPPTEWPSLPPIGRPIARTEVYVLDQRLNLVPIGVPGELYIGGQCLARGYVYRPDATAEKFIPHPFADKPGARLYKTGDLARYRSDGNIEFLGRIDDQTKIRGFRIEPGEIEAVLAEHPAVREAAVVARIETPLEKRLVAYVACNGDPPPSVTELRHFLVERLPEYMVPSIFVIIDALPLTPSGKVDRRALPTPEQRRPEQDVLFVAPSTAGQILIAKIWADVLKLDRVGIDDNFFDLGGHSLLATQVISRLREAFSLELPLRTLFEKPTIAGLADAVEATRVNSAQSPSLKISPLTRQLHRVKLAP